MEQTLPSDILRAVKRSVLEEALGLAGTPAQPAAGRPAILVGKCDSHEGADAEGRYLVSYRDASGQTGRGWLASLRETRLRRGDLVLMLWPENWPEPVITGVLVGVCEQDRPPAWSAPEVVLREGETLEVRTADGAMLLEISRGEAGPTVRLGQPDICIEMPGRLAIQAESIALEAQSGDVRIHARDDVVVRGEKVRLN
jgi:hypothetical protein